MHVQELLGPRDAIVVTGSINAMRLDRKLDRADLRPVQVLDEDGWHPVPCMQAWGDLGVSSLAWHPEALERLYATTGGDLRCYDLDRSTVEEMAPADLDDVHEMAVIGDTLWLANTGRDEAVGIPLARGEARRVDLDRFRADAPTARADQEVRNRFHGNQVFADHQGHLAALVHHVTGRQVLTKVAEKLLKKQGHGGVIDLETGEARDLGLSGPHSVRLDPSGTGYWVCDSGTAQLNHYDAAWNLVGQVATAGWGRGADWLGRYLLAGSSPIRKRYLDIIPGAKEGPSTLEAFDAEADGRLAASCEVPNVEQINNVYRIDRRVAEQLIAFEAPAA
ncbi:MAG: hypothetical protein ACPGQL_11175 [Thermoplasmatota archaeon]